MEQVAELEAAKEAAVAANDFALAGELHGRLEAAKQAAMEALHGRLQELEAAKQAAIAANDFAEAAAIQAKLEAVQAGGGSPPAAEKKAPPPAEEVVYADSHEIIGAHNCNGMSAAGSASIDALLLYAGKGRKCRELSHVKSLPPLTSRSIGPSIVASDVSWALLLTDRNRLYDQHEIHAYVLHTGPPSPSTHGTETVNGESTATDGVRSKVNTATQSSALPWQSR